MKVLVLGGTGMLGSMATKVLAEQGHEVFPTSRSGQPYPYDGDLIRWRLLSVEDESVWREIRRQELLDVDWIVNCLGATKPLMGEPSAEWVNGTFGWGLVREAKGVRVIHASTDCVFDGSGGWPCEVDKPTALDDYGRSKASGEPDGALVLRCSIIGPECREPARNLLGAAVEGRVAEGRHRHLWNGVTTLQWAKVVAGVIDNDNPIAGRVHLVPGGSCSKDRLVATILQAFGWLEHPLSVDGRGSAFDMRMSTARGDEVLKLWGQAGYDNPPGIEQMVWELAEYCAEEKWPQAMWRYWRCGR